jgi:hypothetical protein
MLDRFVLKASVVTTAVPVSYDLGAIVGSLKVIGSIDSAH